MRLCLLLLALVAIPGLMAEGVAEDSQDRVTRSWDWDEGRNLELRGQIEFTVRPGPRWKVTVEASRALFDQLVVGHGWGKTSVVVEAGLRGPREPGLVLVTVEAPGIETLEVASSHGFIEGVSLTKLAAWEGSAVTVRGELASLAVEASWGSAVTLEGRVASLRSQIDTRAWVDTRKAWVGHSVVRIRQGTYWAGSTDEGKATVGEDGRLEADDRLPWTLD